MSVQINQTYVRQGRDLAIVTRAEGEVTDSLEPGAYRICFDPVRGWWFTTMSDFSLPSKLYGNIDKRAARILDTYRDRLKKGDPTGVLLSGVKGTGKTLLAKKVAIDSGLPIIIVNDPHVSDDFMEIIANVGPCIVIFDEFEKVYHQEEAQNAILTFLNGVFSNEALSFVIVNNDRKLVGPLKNRPGRLFYSLDYGGLTEDFIREYCDDKLQPVWTNNPDEARNFDRVAINSGRPDMFVHYDKTKEKIDGVLAIAAMFKDFTFDQLQAIVEEMNRYGETAKEVVEYLNVKIPKASSFDLYDVRIWKGDQEITQIQAKDFRSQSTTPIIEHKYLYFKTKSDQDKDKMRHVYLSENNLVDVDIDSQTFTFFDNSEGVTLKYRKLEGEEKWSRIPMGPMAF